MRNALRLLLLGAAGIAVVAGLAACAPASDTGPAPTSMSTVQSQPTLTSVPAAQTDTPAASQPTTAQDTPAPALPTAQQSVAPTETPSSSTGTPPPPSDTPAPDPPTATPAGDDQRFLLEPPTPTSEPAPPTPPVGSSVGQSAPAFEVTTVEGVTHSLTDFKQANQPVVLYFFATW